MPGVLAGAAVRLLPPSRRDWGDAMLAELDQIERPLARWAFAAGSVRVAVLPPEPNGQLERLGPGVVLAAATGVIALGTYSSVRSYGLASSGGRGPLYTVAATAFGLALLATYTLIALRQVRSAAPRARTARRCGVSAGAVVGATALLATRPPHQPGIGALAAMAAVSLVCGAVAARTSGDNRSGRDAGLWAGMVGGLVLIVGLLGVTFVATGWFAHDASLVHAYQESLSPAHFHDYNAHYGTLTGFVQAENSDTALVGGLVWLPLLGLVFGSVGGALAASGTDGLATPR